MNQPETTPRIPVHVITGFLGSGKSSLIRHLIGHKPHHERWAVVINEFGRVGIDQAMFETRDDVVVKGLPGGCLCCQLSFVLQASLVNLLHRSRPDRMIIEPSGLGHPAGLLELLQGEAFHDVLEVRDVIALLDPRRLSDPRAREHKTFRDQLLMADGVALTMTDLASEAQCEEAYRYLGGMWPLKRWVSEAPHGRLDLDFLLNSGPSEAEMEISPAEHGHRAKPMLEIDLDISQAPTPGKPIRETGEGLGYTSVGWRWHADDVFCLDTLISVLDGLPAGLRIKGVWHTRDGWRLYNRGEGRAELTDSAWRRDSRLEVIAKQGGLPDIDALETHLAECLLGD